MSTRADGRARSPAEREERLESVFVLFALCCLSVGLVVGIGIAGVFGAR